MRLHRISESAAQMRSPDALKSSPEPEEFDDEDVVLPPARPSKSSVMEHGNGSREERVSGGDVGRSVVLCF